MRELVRRYGYYYVYDDDSYIYLIANDGVSDYDIWLYTGMNYD